MIAQIGEVRDRFNSVVTFLLEFQIVANKKELARSIGTYIHIITDIQKHRRNPTMNQLELFIRIYKLDANYFFGKSNTMFKDELKNEDSTTIEDYSNKIKKDAIKKIISLAQEELNKLDNDNQAPT